MKMTGKEAYEIIISKKWEHNIDVISTAHLILKIVADRDTPMKPFYGINRKGKMDALCRECNHDVVLKENFCYNCGQRLDWEEE